MPGIAATSRHLQTCSRVQQEVTSTWISQYLTMVVEGTDLEKGLRCGFESGIRFCSLRLRKVSPSEFWEKRVTPRVPLKDLFTWRDSASSAEKGQLEEKIAKVPLSTTVQNSIAFSSECTKFIIDINLFYECWGPRRWQPLGYGEHFPSW